MISSLLEGAPDWVGALAIVVAIIAAIIIAGIGLLVGELMMPGPVGTDADAPLRCPFRC
jgi:hypothetical protein